MGSDGSRSGPRPQREPVCASCGRPVGTAIKRRKVLGAYVPVWGPGPCHNPQCDACVDESGDKGGGKGGDESTGESAGARVDGD
ncbi:hypothetical protein ACGFSB_29785 [Streptomyces sp. NPDC048441]|uniref:hypothetical protein n=1 Tax=Streptomyces sp. NPDC048441 TaxID=3365552 RepID=UPI00371D1F15